VCWAGAFKDAGEGPRATTETIAGGCLREGEPLVGLQRLSA
jgi:hypothetical protein